MWNPFKKKYKPETEEKLDVGYSNKLRALVHLNTSINVSNSLGIPDSFRQTLINEKNKILTQDQLKKIYFNVNVKFNSFIYYIYDPLNIFLDKKNEIEEYLKNEKILNENKESLSISFNNEKLNEQLKSILKYSNLNWNNLVKVNEFLKNNYEDLKRFGDNNTYKLINLFRRSFDERILLKREILKFDFNNKDFILANKEFGNLISDGFNSKMSQNDSDLTSKSKNYKTLSKYYKSIYDICDNFEDLRNKKDSINYYNEFYNFIELINKFYNSLDLKEISLANEEFIRIIEKIRDDEFKSEEEIRKELKTCEISFNSAIKEIKIKIDNLMSQNIIRGKIKLNPQSRYKLEFKH